MTDARDVAIGLTHEAGWAVMPLSGKGPVRSCRICRMEPHHGAACNCETPWCHGFYGATDDAAVVDARWPHDADGVGIATGKSNLVVVDVDGPAGHGWVTRLARHRILTPTLMMRSASGKGYHLYYEGNIRSRQLRVAGTHPLAGSADDVPVDIKSQGSYVRWTGNVAIDRPIVDVPVALDYELEDRQRRLDAAARPLAPSAPTRQAGADRCVHAPGYVDRGVQMAADRIRGIDRSAGGVHAQVYGVIRSIVRRHAETCGRDCISGEQLDALADAARGLGERPGDFERAWDNALVESGIPARFGTRALA